MKGVPSMVRFKETLKLSAYHTTELLVILGITVSFLAMVIPSLCGTFSLVILWVSFLSVVKVRSPCLC